MRFCGLNGLLLDDFLLNRDTQVFSGEMIAFYTEPTQEWEICRRGEMAYLSLKLR